MYRLYGGECSQLLFLQGRFDNETVPRGLTIVYSTDLGEKSSDQDITSLKFSNSSLLLKPGV